MSDRKEIIGEALDNVIGGTITFDWDGSIGNIGLDGNKCYQFNDRNAMIAFASQCHRDGLSDAECLQGMLAAGIIW